LMPSKTRSGLRRIASDWADAEEEKSKTADRITG